MSTPNDTISLSDAITWTTNWRSQNPNAVKAFLIPKDDLTGVLAENPDAVRAYLAIDDNGQEKLVIVGCTHQIDGTYKDKLPNPRGGDNGNYIFDFTMPCPPVCDPSSQLNG